MSESNIKFKISCNFLTQLIKKNYDKILILLMFEMIVNEI